MAQHNSVTAELPYSSDTLSDSYVMDKNILVISSLSFPPFQSRLQLVLLSLLIYEHLTFLFPLSRRHGLNGSTDSQQIQTLALLNRVWLFVEYIQWHTHTQTYTHAQAHGTTTIDKGSPGGLACHSSPRHTTYIQRCN